jgi:hypothetical protein
MSTTHVMIQKHTEIGVLTVPTELEKICTYIQYSICFRLYEVKSLVERKVRKNSKCFLNSIQSS